MTKQRMDNKQGKQRKWWTTLGVVILALLVPAAVWASDRFDDVADDNVFHDDITWLADAGVTLGCNPPDNTEYCPKDSVTREQMAAFLHRLATNQVVDAATVEGHTAEELIGTEETVVVFEPPSQAEETLYDRDDDGFTAGDFIIEEAVLVDPDTGDQVGTAIEEIRLIEVTEPPSDENPLGDWDLKMEAIFQLEGGDVTFTGYGSILDFAGDGVVLPVTGGSGDYVAVGGTATIALSEEQGEIGPLITLDLVH